METKKNCTLLQYSRFSRARTAVVMTTPDGVYFQARIENCITPVPSQMEYRITTRDIKYERNKAENCRDELCEITK